MPGEGAWPGSQRGFDGHLTGGSLREHLGSPRSCDLFLLHALTCGGGAGPVLIADWTWHVTNIFSSSWFPVETDTQCSQSAVSASPTPFHFGVMLICVCIGVTSSCGSPSSHLFHSVITQMHLFVK